MARSRAAPSAGPAPAEDLRKTVENAREEVRASEFWLDLRHKLCDALLPEVLENVETLLANGLASAPPAPSFSGDSAAADASDVPALDVICYGIGSFAASHISRDQLALALLLRDELGVRASLAVYDPVLGGPEREALRLLGCEALGDNEEGRRRVRRPTLFYMPHCPRRLYSNVLRANWGPDLARLLLLGNSFGHYAERMDGSERRVGRSCVLRALPHCVEAAVAGAGRHRGGLVFNDTALHAFPPATRRPAIAARVGPGPGPAPHETAWSLVPAGGPRRRKQAKRGRRAELRLEEEQPAAAAEGPGEWWERVQPPAEEEEAAGGLDDELVSRGPAPPAAPPT